MSEELLDDVGATLTPSDQRVWHHVGDLPAKWAGCVATIGVFDGFHRGHQELVQRAQVVAAELGLPAVLVTFDPHPLQVLRPERAPRLIATVGERLRQAQDAGVDGVFVQRFDQSFAQVSAATWVEEFLVNGLGVRAVVVGEDFRFGARNAGGVETLAGLGRTHGFDTEPVPLVRSRGQRCSSTWVRELHAAGRLAEATELLGHEQRP